VPLIVFGFDSAVMFASALFSTFMGHFNHSNLDVKLGPLKYVFNNPRLHVWHHDRDEVPLPGANFAIDFAIWDYLFGTVWLPAEDRQPRRLGFDGIEEIGSSFVEQVFWPVWRKR
jgi:sterol desaturase/sphingolipid hydroxylase (fatty acid hydroxylase superfamily)